MVGLDTMKKELETDNNSVLTELRELVLQTVEVKVLGKTLILEPPDPDAAFRIRDEVMAILEDDSQKGRWSSVVCSNAINLCVPGLKDLDMAKRLYNAAGGERSELARKAAGLCGLNSILSGFYQEEDDTPFLSQEKPEKASPKSPASL